MAKLKKGGRENHAKNRFNRESFWKINCYV